jgi:hypothetical protein
MNTLFRRTYQWPKSPKCALFADLSHLAKGWNEITVDGRGNTYVKGRDGCCLDAKGAVWTPAFMDGRPGCSRVADGGEVLRVFCACSAQVTRKEEPR